MTIRHRLAVLAATFAIAAAVATAVAVTGHAGPGGPNVPFALASLLIGVCLAVVGALLLGLRPANRLGPLLYVVGASVLAQFALREYAYSGLVARPGSVPAPGVAGWAGLALDPLFFPVPFALSLLMFPDGRLPSRRWRPVVVAAVAVTAVRMVLLAIRPGPLPDEAYGYAIAWSGLVPARGAALVNDLQDGLNTASILLLPVTAVALVVRYARAGRSERQRLKPLALVAVAVAGSLLLQVVPATATAGQLLLVATVTVALPVALAVGALRYRVWDLDPVIVGAIVYGGLALLIGGGYVAVVVAVSRIAGGTAPTSGLLPSIIATALVAAAFAPVKDRITRAARRLVYGVRATPYDALAALPRHLADVPAVADVLLSTADALTRGLGLPAARVRVFLDGGGESVAWSPAEGGLETLIVVPVRHLGRVVGDVAVQPWTDRPLSNRERRLLADLAVQAGPALRSVALATELQDRLDQITEQSAQLRASRQRIVTAQLAERRRLERDLHDGAQQQLVTLAVSIREVEKQVAAGQPGPTVIAALAECRAELGRCIDEVRLLAGGIYPPVLIARGLAAALRARARLGTGDVRVQATPALDGTRFPTEVEMSVYFCCLEALQNAAKHAPGAPVRVRLDATDTALTFEVTDDGPGLDPRLARAAGGSGLLGMEDRIGVVGGTLAIDSAPGHGCTVRGTIPLPFGP